MNSKKESAPPTHKGEQSAKRRAGSNQQSRLYGRGGPYTGARAGDWPAQALNKPKSGASHAPLQRRQRIQRSVALRRHPLGLSKRLTQRRLAAHMIALASVQINAIARAKRAWRSREGAPIMCASTPTHRGTHDRQIGSASQHHISASAGAHAHTPRSHRAPRKKRRTTSRIVCATAATRSRKATVHRLTRERTACSRAPGARSTGAAGMSIRTLSGRSATLSITAAASSRTSSRGSKTGRSGRGYSTGSLTLPPSLVKHGRTPVAC